MKLTMAGKSVHAATGGLSPAPGAPALILIHGAGMDGTVWSMQSRYFARHGHRVLALDLPGHGRSEGPVISSVPKLADWVAAVMEQAEIETAVLAGHSMGSLAVLHLAASFPDRVTGLALLATAATMRVHPELQTAAERDPGLAAELIADWGYGAAMHRGGHQLPGFWAMGAGLALLNQAKKGVLPTDLAACAAYDQALEKAAQIRCPTVCILGQDDRMTRPAQAARLADAITGSERVIIPDAGHMMMIEKPYEVGRALKTVL